MAKATSGSITLARRIVAFRRESLEHAPFEYLHLLFRVLQCCLAILEELRPAPVSGQRLGERQLPSFHRREDALQFGERRFEALRWVGGCGHRGSRSRAEGNERAYETDQSTLTGRFRST